MDERDDETDDGKGGHGCENRKDDVSYDVQVGISFLCEVGCCV